MTCDDACEVAAVSCIPHVSCHCSTSSLEF